MPPRLSPPLLPWLFLFLLIPSPTHTISPSPTCPILLPTPSSHSRIVGGYRSTNHTARYLAALHNPLLFNTFQCTAVLLSPYWLLTAAHCQVSAFWQAHLTATTAYGGHVLPIAAVFNPPQNSTPPFAFRADIALIKLSAPAPPNASFALINAFNTHPIPFSFARAVGYGDIAYSHPNPNHSLRHVDVPVMSFRHCIDAYPYVTRDRLCAGYPRGGCDSCQGDSGGPLFQFDSAATPVVVALVSSGYRCAEPSYPGIYMRVAAFVGWMRDVGAKFNVAQDVQNVMYQQTPSSSVLPLPSMTPSVTSSVSPLPGGAAEGDVLPSIIPTVSIGAAATVSPSATDGMTQSPPPSLQYRCPVLLPEAPLRRTAVRVNGGSEVSDWAASYLVAFADAEHHVRCSGVLLSARWVLTTSRCDITEEWSAYVGSRFAGLGMPMAVARVFAQPSANETLPRLALVQFPEDVPGRDAQFAKVNENEALPAMASVARFLGYGMSGANTSTDVFIPDSGVPARQLDLVISGDNSCRQWWNAQVMSQNFCGEHSSDVPFCQLCRGDDGGPLVQFDAAGNVVAVGIAIGVPEMCGVDEDPALFASTAGAVEWMRDIGVQFEVGEASQVFTAADDEFSGSDSLASVGIVVGLIAALLLTATVVTFVLTAVLRRRTA